MKCNPEVNELLRESERLVEYSQRKPRILVGISSMIVGLPSLVEPVLNGFSSAGFVAEFFIGILCLYAAVWTLYLCKREYVCITDERVLYSRRNLLARGGKVQSFSLRDVAGARLCKTAVMHRQHYVGEILIILKQGNHYILPLLKNGQFILDAIRESCDTIATSDREAAEQHLQNDPVPTV